MIGKITDRGKHLQALENGKTDLGCYSIEM